MGTVKKTRLSKTNINKRLSLTSNILNKKDEYFETLSNKSTDSRYSIHSKISLISSNSYRSIFTSNSSDANAERMSKLSKEDEICEQKMKRMKLKNAGIHLEIERMKTEKDYYAKIIKSIQDVAKAYDDSNDFME